MPERRPSRALARLPRYLRCMDDALPRRAYRSLPPAPRRRMISFPVVSPSVALPRRTGLARPRGEGHRQEQGVAECCSIWREETAIHPRRHQPPGRQAVEGLPADLPHRARSGRRRVLPGTPRLLTHLPYGVPPEYIVAIVGVETFYGRTPVLLCRRAGTLAFYYPKRAVLREQLNRSCGTAGRTPRRSASIPHGFLCGRRASLAPSRLRLRCRLRPRRPIDRRADGHLRQRPIISRARLATGGPGRRAPSRMRAG